jgi:hypothetical protein
MSPNTPVEDALLDFYLMLSEAGSPLYLFEEVVGFMGKHTGHTFQKGVTLPCQETLIKQMQQQHRLSIAEKCGANKQWEQSKAPLTVRYEIHKSPRQEYSNQLAEQTMSPNNLVVCHLIMVQRNGEKWSWITSGSHTSIGIHWHPFGVLEADDYRQNNRLRFGNKLIFVNYIYMHKKEFK